MTIFRVNDIIVNRLTSKKAMVVDVEYLDEIGGMFRFNTKYERHWEKVE